MLVEGQKCNNRCGVSASDASHGSDRYQSNLQRISIAFPLYFHCVSLHFVFWQHLVTASDVWLPLHQTASWALLWMWSGLCSPVLPKVGSRESKALQIDQYRTEKTCARLWKGRTVELDALQSFFQLIRKDISWHFMTFPIFFIYLIDFSNISHASFSSETSWKNALIESPTRTRFASQGMATKSGTVLLPVVDIVCDIVVTSSSHAVQCHLFHQNTSICIHFE